MSQTIATDTSAFFTANGLQIMSIPQHSSAAGSATSRAGDPRARAARCNHRVVPGERLHVVAHHRDRLLDVEVDFSVAQTCCGQPLVNTG